MSLHYGTVNNQGRIVLPVEVRRALDIQAGDRLDFVIEADVVHLVTPRMRAEALWAKNSGGDAGDSTRAVRDSTRDAGDSTRNVRAARTADQAKVAARWARIDAAVAESGARSEDEIAEEVFAALGLKT